MFACANKLGLVLRFLTLSLCCCSVSSINDPSIPDGLFYSFGEDEGDSLVPIGRFNYSEIQLSKAVAFDNEYYGKLNVEIHGLLAFGHRYEGDTPADFPINGDRMVATYWAGADTSLNNGRVYYRETADSQLLEQATQEFRADLGQTDQLYSFTPEKLFIATWHNITFNQYGTPTSPVNSFQAILAWSRKQTAVSYRYAKLTWTTGGYSGGNTNGMSGVPAAMGYNSGNSDFYYTHPWSGSSDILNLVNSSNVGVVGRYSYRIDRLLNDTDCYDNDADADDLCPLPYQRYNQYEGVCQDFAPPFGCPALTGPFEKPSGIRNQKKFEFNCAVVNGSDNPLAVYEVAFHFNDEVDCNVPSSCHEQVSVTAGASLSSDGLRGRNKMGKWIGCKVRSYWKGTEQEKSNYLKSKEYYMGLEFSTRSVRVKEDELLPKTILVKSTVPITCFEDESETCSLELKYHVTNQNAGESTVALRQRYPNINPFSNGCGFIITQDDWKVDENRAYNTIGSLEVLAKLDPLTTGLRTAWLTFHVDTPGSEQSIWFGFESPIIELHHEDVPDPLVGCHINADPHLLTFDEQAYSTHCHGKYYYSRNSPGGVGFEVQARHCPCWGTENDLRISCICGIAIREDRLILVADTCNKNRVITYSSRDDHPSYHCSDDNGCGMFNDGTTFKLVTPSGNRVYGTVYGVSQTYAYINAQVLVNARFMNVTGLCGSPDGHPENDWSFADSGNSIAIPPGSDPWPPKDLVDSWGSPPKSLFEFRYNADLPIIDDDSDQRILISYCECTRNRNTGETSRSCGGSAIAQQQWPGDPKNTLPTPDPTEEPKDSDCNTFLPSDYCRTNMLRRSSWPTKNGITEEVANNTCWSRILNTGVIGDTCFQLMMNNSETAQHIVDQCVADVLETGDFSWAYDKINDVQRICYLKLITTNNSDVNDTAEAIDIVLSSLQEVTAYMCVPVDCNGHGECVNGTCRCEGDYVGSDCGVSKSARPVVRSVFSKDILDIRNNSAEGVSLIASDVANTPEMTCKFETRMLNGISKTYTLHGFVTSPSTVVCKIPKEPMNYTSKGLDFTKLHAPGFNFSCLSAGSPVVTYALSISNDGQTFSNAVEIKLFDSLCVMCDGVACTPVPNTCNIKGYCFADQDKNPYMKGCEICDSTVSDSSWTLVSAGNDSCPNVTTCQFDEVCVPDLEFNYECRTFNLLETTEPPGSAMNTATTGSDFSTRQTDDPNSRGCGSHGQHVTARFFAVLMAIVVVNTT